MRSIDALRLTFARNFVVFLWGNAALVTLVAVLVGAESPLLVLVLSVAVAGGATLAWIQSPISLATRLITSGAASAFAAILVYDLAGRGYMIDMHMYFFATLAML